MQWLEIAVSIPPEDVEAVCNFFVEFDTGGVAVDDPAFISAYMDLPPDAVVPGALTAPEMPVVRAYLPVDGRLEERLARLRQTLTALWPVAARGLKTRLLDEQDWANAWRAYYKPVPVGRSLVVKPSWEEYRVDPGRHVIELDPGMAFGCGTHPTTVMCLELLEETVASGETVIDVGTGSGILAVAAALLGAGRVTAVDNDPVAVAAARENIIRNGVQGIVTAKQGDLLAGEWEPAGLVAANIVADVIIRLAPAAAMLLKPGGLFIVSGIIRDREAQVRWALAAAGLSVSRERRGGEWVALAAGRV
ncbi:50S ribosomal protein L11 methyltransferase [Desulfotomaculum copahuensis]|uniref:Ribosomal protein L11 methyltransferase n=1 Tax=Desulfotomaculum copahuensis TaxID=1838280 RepID=A0A1B7LF85_9FIRM|nr:50S ribosomal protein L11 methyltransferase [Desulfotomaculum copahuensis]OAT82300.1 ribosomal protein L11 methyltransferase [Desulfotomaculum copahuensis]